MIVRKTLIFIEGLIAGIVLLIAGEFIVMKHHGVFKVINNYKKQFNNVADEVLISNYKERLLRYIERLSTAKTEHEFWIASYEAGFWCVDADFLNIAEQFANECLLIAKKYENGISYGNAIYNGHITLGRIELRRGNISDAKQHLVLAGKTPGSPSLATFGPNMLLARELLEKGEKEIVFEFFQLCEEFWESGLKELKKWKKQVRNGEIPYFGANLAY